MRYGATSTELYEEAISMTGRKWDIYRFIASMLSGEEMRAEKLTAIESQYNCIQVV